MNEKGVWSFGHEFLVRSFTNVDPDESGVEIRINNELVGQIEGIYIPDIDDEETNICFDVEIQNWLEENYWNN